MGPGTKGKIRKERWKEGRRTCFLPSCKQTLKTWGSIFIYFFAGVERGGCNYGIGRAV